MLLEDIQLAMFEKARKYRDEHITRADTLEEFERLLDEKGGFILAHWDGTPATEEAIKEKTKATIRCIRWITRRKRGSVSLTASPAGSGYYLHGPISLFILRSMENLKEEVLAVQVDAISMDYLRRTAGLANRTFIVAIFFCFIFIGGSLLYTLSIDPEKFVRNLGLYLQMRSHLWIEIISSVLMVIQLYQYRRFTKQAAKATQFRDSDQFNAAFKFLYKSSQLAFAQVALSFVYGLLLFWVNLSFFAAMRARP